MFAYLFVRTFTHALRPDAYYPFIWTYTLPHICHGYLLC